MTREEAKKTIDELIDRIDYYNTRYYQDNVSEISDYEFDQLLKSLEKLEADFPAFKYSYSPTQRVGGTITKSFATAPSSGSPPCGSGRPRTGRWG